MVISPNVTYRTHQYHLPTHRIERKNGFTIVIDIVTNLSITVIHCFNIIVESFVNDFY